MVGGASPVLRRLAAPVALLAVILAYYTWHESLPALSFWGNVAWLAFVVFPAVFGLVYFALPFWQAPWWQLLTAGVSLLLAGLLLQWIGGGLEGNFAKLAAMTALGFFAAKFIEEVWWLVLIGSAIALVDSYSVWRGPTHQIVQNETRTSSRRSRSRSRCRASRASHASASPTCSSSRSSSPRALASASAHG